MIWLNFKRILRTGFVNFWRNGVVSLSAVLIMTITLLIISTVLFTSGLLEHSLQSLKEKVDVNITTSTFATEESVLGLKTQLENLPEVESVEYISREQALEAYRERHASDAKILAALDELDKNPLGATLNVIAKEPDQYESVQNFIQSNYPAGEPSSIIDSVNYVEKQLAISRLSQIINAGEQFGLIITILFVILSILITLNTIRLAMFISKEEIKLMNLIGAESSYISGPFIVTGSMYGIISSILVLIILYPLTYWLGPKIAPIFFDLNLFNYYIGNFGQMFVILFFSGILIGSISSFLGINRYLKG